MLLMLGLKVHNSVIMMVKVLRFRFNKKLFWCDM